MSVTSHTDRNCGDAQVAGASRSPLIDLPMRSNFPNKSEIQELLAAAPPDCAWPHLIANDRKIEDEDQDFRQDPSPLVIPGAHPPPNRPRSDSYLDWKLLATPAELGAPRVLSRRHRGGSAGHLEFCPGDTGEALSARGPGSSLAEFCGGASRRQSLRAAWCPSPAAAPAYGSAPPAAPRRSISPSGYRAFP